MSGLLGVARDVGRELQLRHAAEEQHELELTETERWARDPIGWINDHVYVATKFGPEHTHSTLLGSRVRPAKIALFPAQEETIASWVDLDHLAKTGQLRFRNVADEKSRQIGETVGVAAANTWILHYHPATGGFMHKRSAEVDDGGDRATWRSFFGKIRFIDRRLDRSKVPGLGRLVFRPFSREPAKVENTQNGSVLYGEGQIDDPFRGMTLDYIEVDEAAFVEHGERVFAAIDEACPTGKLLLSTVNGDQNFHARICDEKPAGYRILRHHWSDHPVYSEGLHVAGEDPDCAMCEGNRQKVRWTPNKPQAHRYPGRETSPWYDNRVVGKTDEQVANELDIDRARSRAGRVYPEFSDDVHVEAAGIPYDQGLMAKLELHWDFGLDVTAVVVCQDAPFEYRVIGLLEMGDRIGTTATPEVVSEALLGYLNDLGVPRQYLRESWLRRISCWGDPAQSEGRDLRTGRPLVDAYQRLGWNIAAPPRRYRRTVETSIASVKRLLLGHPKPLRVCGFNAAEFAAHMRNNTWPVDPLGNRRLGGGPPVDDEHNHACRAFAYGIVSKWPPPMDEPPEEMDALEAEHLESLRERDGRLDQGIRYGMTL